ncbi:MAG: metal-sulfur cluster assembly factor, partial [archaeon]
MVTEKQVKEKLKEVKDPHIGLDIVSLGFINKLNIDGNKVDIEVVLTSPGCPMARQITKEVEKAVESMEEVEEVDVSLNLDYQWTPEDMSEEAQEKLGHLF